MAVTAIPTVASVMCRTLAGVGTCTFAELVHRLPTYSLSQVFSAVDRLSRQGTILVLRVRGVDYVISNLAGSLSFPILRRTGSAKPYSSQMIRYDERRSG